MQFSKLFLVNDLKVQRFVSKLFVHLKQLIHQGSFFAPCLKLINKTLRTWVFIQFLKYYESV